MRDNSTDPVTCMTPTCDRSVTHAESCGPCMQAMDYASGVCANTIHPCDHHRKLWLSYQEAERRIVEWHRARATHYVHLNKLADWHNECADAIERGEHRHG